MRYLLDTNILIWYLTGNVNLNPNLYEIIAFKGNVYTSIVSLQEIAIKSRDGGLTLKISFNELCDTIKQDTTIKVLPIEIEHLSVLHKLVPSAKHNDPFDHLIISQAIHEKMCLLSSDGHFHNYCKQGLLLIENEK
jgi:PIN domain nuclease of toxin-antitoxin system